MANPTLTQIELPSGTTYDLVDQGARDLISGLNNWSYVVCTNAANTPKDVQWDSGGTTVTGTLVASSSTMYKIYLVPSINGTNDVYDEYITINPSGSTYKWEMFGNTSVPDLSEYAKTADLGALAFKDNASGSGTVAVPKTFTTTVTPGAKDVSVTGTTTGSVTLTKSAVEIKPKTTGTAANKYTPGGSVTSTFTGTAASGTVSGTAAAQTFTGTGVRLETDSAVVTGASFSGASMTSTGNFTPSGSISVGTGTANYTPAGSISVSTAGSTTTIKNPTSKTVVTDMSVAAPSSTAATGELVYCSVSGTKLSLQKFVETTGDSITTSNTTVKTGDATYGFAGTGAQLKFTGTQGSVSVSGTTTGSVTPTSGKVTVSPAASGTATYTPAGSNASSSISGTASVTATGSVSSSFSGTDTYFETASEVGTAASFSGASMTSTGSYTPSISSASTTVATTEDKTVSVTVS